ncbi:MAG: hypothetical protein QOF84_1572 [Streptomyces sp.]|jgi:hypothetical protein|nr:hypothetical protein [Streptomyces sp.]MDX6346782.1 hypothetical protein [Streptomyces sp.]
MRVSTKIRNVLCITVATTVLGIGVAIAAFTQESTSDPVAGTAESFAPITVTGAQTGKLRLLPGETADVTLTFTNPNSNVRAKLTSIAAGDVVVDTVASADDKTYCHDQIALSTAGVGPLPTLDLSQANLPFVLADAVKMKEDTDIRCQGMTFHTTWTVESQAVR